MACSIGWVIRMELIQKVKEIKKKEEFEELFQKGFDAMMPTLHDRFEHFEDNRIGSLRDKGLLRKGLLEPEDES